MAEYVIIIEKAGKNYAAMVPDCLLYTSLLTKKPVARSSVA